MGQLKLKRTNFKIGTNFKIDTKCISLLENNYYYEHSYIYFFYTTPFYTNDHILKIEKIHFEKGYKNIPIFQFNIY